MAAPAPAEGLQLRSLVRADHVLEVFLESVPVKDPARVVSLYSNAQSRKGPPQEYLPTPYLNAVDYREKTNVFSGASVAIFTAVKFVVSGKQTQQLFAELVNGNFFEVLGVQPFLGRGFSQAEDASPSPVTVMSYALWNTQFGEPLAVSSMRSLQFTMRLRF